MPSVQFRTSAETVEAFGQTNCEAWSLWDGKRYMFKGIGEAELQSFLDLMNQSGASNAVYTLAYYEDLTDKKKINSKTPFDGSFNFRLNSDNMEISTNQYREFHQSNNMQSRVGAMEAKLDRVLERIDGGLDPEPAENKLGVIGDIIAHPAIAPVLPQLISAVMDRLLGTSNNPVVYEQKKLGMVAGFNNETKPAAEPEPLPASLLGVAIARLKKLDPKLPEHMAKLADIAEQDKMTFDYVIGQLEKIPTQ